MKLHLGCGLRKIHGFINIDALPTVGADVVEDVFTLPSFLSGSVELCYACHVLEHSKRATYLDVLRRWFDILKPTGTLRLAVPDLRAAMEWYLSTGNLRDIHGLLYGGQADDYDHHGIGWDEKTLTEDLRAVGFTNVHRYDWRQTEHFYCDDYSMSSLPFVQYFTRRPDGILGGKAVSLNIEAIKP